MKSANAERDKEPRLPPYHDKQAGRRRSWDGFGKSDYIKVQPVFMGQKLMTEIAR